MRPPIPPPVPIMTSQDAKEVWRWRQWAIVGLGLAILALLAWQLSTLSPRGWCQTAFDFSKTDKVTEVVEALKTCVNLQVRILDIKDHVIIGLIVAVIMTQLLFMVSEFGMRASVKGPAGFGADVGKDDDQPKKIEGEVTLTDTGTKP